MTTAASLSLENLSKAYEGAPVVKGLSLTLPRGQLLTLLGPSGCGKTTTLKLIAGLLQPDEGDVRFNGASVLGLPPERRGLGMVFSATDAVSAPHGARQCRLRLTTTRGAGG